MQNSQKGERKMQDLKSQIQMLAGKVYEKMQTIDELNEKYKQKQEQSFLKTFISLMDKMSEELKIAQQKYKSIDLQLLKDKRVEKLEKQLFFFREQCLVLSKQIQKLETQLQKEIDTTLLLKEQKVTLYNALINKQKQRSKISSKMAQLKKQNTTTINQNDRSQKLQELTTIVDNKGIQSYRVSEKGSKLKRISIDSRNSIQEPKTKTGLPLQNNYKNELLSIWESCISDVTTQQKKVKFLSKTNRTNILQRFLSTERIFEILKSKIFDIKCCNHFDCILNNYPNQNIQQNTNRSNTSRPRIQTARPRSKMGINIQWKDNLLKQQSFRYQDDYLKIGKTINL